MEWGKISQIRNILGWLQNYQRTGILADRERRTDKKIREEEKKLRADNFKPPKDISFLIEQLERIVNDYLEGIPFE